MKNIKDYRVVILIIAALAIIYFGISAAGALLLGVICALSVGNPITKHTRLWAQKMLMVAVVGLGAGMDLRIVGVAGLHGMGYTFLTITATMIIGTLLGRAFKTETDTSLLISVGTAICGGSAIAAAAAAIKAKSEEISVALAIVFILNALALFIFPQIGHALGMGQVQFGLWSALAVHDTSSVIGTSMQYGALALQTGTTVKLARALWIIPMTIFVSRWRRPRLETGDKTSLKIPWFILGFVIMAALVTWVPGLKAPGEITAAWSRVLLVLTLFLIGANLTRETLKSVGLRPFVQGAILWVIVSVSTAALIKFSVIAL